MAGWKVSEGLVSRSPVWSERNVDALSVVIILTLAAALPSAQDKPVYRSNIGTVPLFATVLDSRGRLMPNLSQADFSIVDNGKSASIALFSNEPQPFTAVVMLDTSASMTAHLDLLTRAAEQFLSRLSAGDRAQVGAFNDEIQLSGRFTNDSNELIRELKGLDIGNPTRLYDGIGASLGRTRRRRRTASGCRLHRRGGHGQSYQVRHGARSCTGTKA